jgi:hypothetical protein
MKKRIWQGICLGICLVALTAVAIPGGTVYAQDENPPQPGTFSNERLEFA